MQDEPLDPSEPSPGVVRVDDHARGDGGLDVRARRGRRRRPACCSSRPQLLSGLEHPLVLAVLAATYVLWGVALRANLGANWALLAVDRDQHQRALEGRLRAHQAAERRARSELRRPRATSPPRSPRRRPTTRARSAAQRGASPARAGWRPQTSTTSCKPRGWICSATSSASASRRHRRLAGHSDTPQSAAAPRAGARATTSRDALDVSNSRDLDGPEASALASELRAALTRAIATLPDRHAG